MLLRLTFCSVGDADALSLSSAPATVRRHFYFLLLLLRQLPTVEKVFVAGWLDGGTRKARLIQKKKES